jgi:hypothetical protein
MAMMLDLERLDGQASYRIDGLGPGQWQLVWQDGGEAAVHSPAVRALVRLDRLTEVGPGHLHLII